MAKTITLREARMHALRGNTDRPEEPPEKPAPAPQAEDQSAKAIESVSLALGQVSEAVLQSGMAGHSALQSVAEAMQRVEAATRKEPDDMMWEFRITERDLRGNIVAFTAAPKLVAINDTS